MILKNPEPNENCFIRQLFRTCTAHSKSAVFEAKILYCKIGMFLSYLSQDWMGTIFPSSLQTGLTLCISKIYVHIYNC